MIEDTRTLQLDFFQGNCRIRQDQDLIDLMAAHRFSKAWGVGMVDYFSQFVELVEKQKVDFAFFIIQEPFDFDQLCDQINTMIHDYVNPGGLVYVSINKYLIVPRCYSPDLPEDFDLAIKERMIAMIQADCVSHKSCGIDRGHQFNWVHPLTRFLFRVT